MDELVGDIARAYEQHIVAGGKEAHLLVLTAFLLTFGLTRVNTHMIRSQRFSWWPGNVEVGGRHIHHLVWGILLLLGVGYASVAFEPPSPWREILAVLFGVGMGLTLDEFALWLNLEDVYWAEKGRSSIDAVVIAAGFLGLTLLGLSFWIEVLEAGLATLGVGDKLVERDQSTALLVASQATGVALSAVAFLKSKPLVGAVGLFVPIVALLGAIRLAKPGSRWARRYGPEKAQRARTRFAGTPDEREPATA